MREILRLGTILLIISAVAAAVLAYTNEITSGPIEQQIIQKNIESRKSVLSDASDFEEIPKKRFADYTGVSEVCKGLKNEKVVGFTIKTKPKGYGGPIEMMVGIHIDGTITGVGIGEHAETPGLGAKSLKSFFIDQYTGKDTKQKLSTIKSGTPKESEIQAVSGATITSEAITSGVNTAIKIFNEKFNK